MLSRSMMWYFVCVMTFCFFKQKTAYEMRISDWSSDVCSSDLPLSSGLSCGQHRDVVIGQLAVAGHQDQVFGLRLGDQHAVEGVAMQQRQVAVGGDKIGRASCRERVCQYV